MGRPPATKRSPVRGTGSMTITRQIRCVLLAHQFMDSFYFGWACSGRSSLAAPETFGISGVRAAKYSWGLQILRLMACLPGHSGRDGEVVGLRPGTRHRRSSYSATVTSSVGHIVGTVQSVPRDLSLSYMRRAITRATAMVIVMAMVMALELPLKMATVRVFEGR